MIAVARVHVHWARASESDCASLERLLDARERARADRFRRPLDRRRFVAARGLLRRHVGAGPLRFTEHGKPYLPGGPQFSIAHSGDLVVVALAQAPVGVDVEQIRPGLNTMAIARRCGLEAVGLHDAAGFFRAWVRFEARAKADGRGLSAAGRNLTGDFDVDDLDDLPPGYVGAVAVPA